MRTLFGKTLRGILAEREMTQCDIAVGLRVSPAYVSGVVVGINAIPSDWTTRIAYLVGLNPADTLRLRRAEQGTNTTLDLAHLSAEDRQLAVALVHGLQLLSELERKKLCRRHGVISCST